MTEDNIQQAQEKLEAIFKKKNLDSLKSWVNQYPTFINEPIDNEICQRILWAYSMYSGEKNQTLLSIVATMADHIYSNEKHLEILKFLLENKADPNKKIGEPEGFLVDKILSYERSGRDNHKKRMVIHLLLTYNALYEEATHTSWNITEHKLPTLFALCTHTDGWKYIDTLIEHGSEWNQTHRIQTQSGASITSLIQMAAEEKALKVGALILLHAYQHRYSFNKEDISALDKLKADLMLDKDALKIQIWMHLTRTKVVELFFQNRTVGDQPSLLEKYDIQNTLIRIFEGLWRSSYKGIIKVCNDSVTLLDSENIHFQTHLPREVREQISEAVALETEAKQHWSYQNKLSSSLGGKSEFSKLHDKFRTLLNCLVSNNSSLSLQQSAKSLSQAIHAVEQECEAMASDISKEYLSPKVDEGVAELSSLRLTP